MLEQWFYTLCTNVFMLDDKLHTLTLMPDVSQTNRTVIKPPTPCSNEKQWASESVAPPLHAGQPQATVQLHKKEPHANTDYSLMLKIILIRINKSIINIQRTCVLSAVPRLKNRVADMKQAWWWTSLCGKLLQIHVDSLCSLWWSQTQWLSWGATLPVCLCRCARFDLVWSRLRAVRDGQTEMFPQLALMLDGQSPSRVIDSHIWWVPSGEQSQVSTNISTELPQTANTVLCGWEGEE